MNRLEVRKLKSMGLSEGQIIQKAENDARDAGFDDGFKKGMKNCSEVMFYMMAYVAELHFDLSQEDLVKFMKRVYTNIDSYRTGQLTPEDFDIIKQEMEEKGIKMV